MDEYRSDSASAAFRTSCTVAEGSAIAAAVAAVAASRSAQEGTRAVVSPAIVRAQVTLTCRELAAATRRRAIACARKLGLLDG